MRKSIAGAALAAAIVASPALANHPGLNGQAFPTRGACEAAMAQLVEHDKDFLTDTFPNLFSSKGVAASFLTRAFTCDQNPGDGNWYVTDRRLEVMGSEWFQRRN